jgi:hypothetical protein
MHGMRIRLSTIFRPLNSNIVIGIMVYRISSMYTHDRKILRILVVAYVMEFLSVVIIQFVAMMYGSKVESSGKLLAMYFLRIIK